MIFRYIICRIIGHKWSWVLYNNSIYIEKCSRCGLVFDVKDDYYRSLYW